MYRITLPLRNSYRRRWSWKCLENNVPSFPLTWMWKPLHRKQSWSAYDTCFAVRDHVRRKGKENGGQGDCGSAMPTPFWYSVRIYSVALYHLGGGTESTRPASNCYKYQNNCVNQNRMDQDLSRKADKCDDIPSAGSYTSD